MRRFVFFTTNRVKLAHFKYIGEKCGVDISGFRERTFYASYHEPRISDRKVLLEESYQSALSQWVKKGQSLDDVFFLEDTSVKVNALSGNEDVPGVDVKYWMKGMTFHKLNRLLADNGGDRSVVVRSDIVAHLPETIRSAYGIECPYVWVYAEQRGRIVSRQHALETNLVFPWLDNKTFNRWFIPDGCDVPISALDVREADKYDFRLAAFGKIVDEFSKFGVPFGRREGKYSQLSLPGIDRPSVYVISGFSCAGKSTLAEWLAKEFGALHIEASDFMYQQFWQRHGVSSKVKIGDFAEKALLQLPSIVSEQAAKMTIEAKVPVVITGFRSSNEVEDLRSRLHGYSINLVFIDANRDLRFDRARLRAREEVTRERFEKRDRQEKRMGLVKIRALSDASVILNESTFADFYQSFEKAFDIKNSMRVLRNGDPVRLGQLEKVIIQALASKDRRCFGDEDYCWYTTTEIAALIAGQFGIKKSKDNVSRYFNQSFHPFYELMHENKKFLCRLSNTGVGVALLLGPEPEHGSRKLRHGAGKTYLLFK